MDICSERMGCKAHTARSDTISYIDRALPELVQRIRHKTVMFAD